MFLLIIAVNILYPLWVVGAIAVIREDDPAPKRQKKCTNSREEEDSRTTILLHDGVQMPLVAFGTADREPSSGAALRAAIIEGGVRHIDSAIWYGEQWLGRELKRILIREEERNIITRSVLFITTKLEPSDEAVGAALKRYDKNKNQAMPKEIIIYNSYLKEHKG